MISFFPQNPKREPEHRRWWNGPNLSIAWDDDGEKPVPNTDLTTAHIAPSALRKQWDPKTTESTYKISNSSVLFQLLMVKDLASLNATLERKSSSAADYSGDFEKLEKMEWAFSKRDVEHFRKVLESHPSLFLRIHAVCMLADLKNEAAVLPLTRVLRSDESPLVRHEAAFVLGQLGFKSAVPSLIDAMSEDDSVLVRHESAVALGSIGDERARERLFKAAKDVDEDVRYSAECAIADLDFLRHLKAKTR